MTTNFYTMYKVYSGKTVLMWSETKPDKGELDYWQNHEGYKDAKIKKVTIEAPFLNGKIYLPESEYPHWLMGEKYA